MNHMLRIAIADDEADMRDFYQRILPRLGYLVVAVAENGQQLIEAARDHRPDLVITDIKMPEVDGLDAVHEINAQSLIPAILVSAYHDPEFMERARRDHILAYLVKPIKAADLEPAIALAMQRFNEYRMVEQEACSPETALADRKIVNEARQILMKRGRLSEQDAFAKLERLSREKGLKLIEIAHSIIMAEQAFVE